MKGLDVERLKELGQLNKGGIGTNENSVKYKFAIPFLECFGWDSPDFEHPAQGNRIDVLARGDNGQTICIEVKAYSVALEPHVPKLKDYCHQRDSILGVLLSGEEVRIYSPYWRVPGEFCKKMLYRFRRKDLADDCTLERLAKLLFRGEQNKLAYIEQREEEIERAMGQVASVRQEHEPQDKLRTDAIERLKEEIEAMQKSLAEEEALQRKSCVELAEKIAAIERDFLLPKVEPRVEPGSEDDAKEKKRAGLKKKPPSAVEWRLKIPELRDNQSLTNWSEIARFVGLVVTHGGPVSGRRQLMKWVQKNRPLWPEVPESSY
jgi:predicted type IV restriction endonuclease